ncbi:MAG: hypothetical protein QNJ40_06095 [Xanthomonadales bacterium]|nr:hypothetical protein [Xanthomonadales bacterium]
MMDLLVYKDTGHVLAAGLRQDRGDSDPDVEEFVGDGLILRDAASGETLVTVPPDHLELRTIDQRDDVLMTARSFVLVDDLPEQKTDPGDPLELDGAKIEVTLPAAAPENLAVSVLIEGGPQPLVHQVDLLKGSTVGTEALNLPSGDYRALVLIPGYRLSLEKVTVP